MEKYRKGTRVEWTWGDNTAEGKIFQSFTQDVERTIKGERVKRKASLKEPAYLIEHGSDGCVLKSHSELRRR